MRGRVRAFAGRAAAGGLALGLAACPRPGAPSRAPGAEPDVRIGIVVGAERVRLAGQGRLAIVAGGAIVARAESATEYQIGVEGRGLVLAGGAGAGRYERLTFVSLDEARYVTLDGRAYRGVIEVFAGSGSLTVVNELPIEAYLAGVVNAEMGRRAPNERAALEAQAIVARTYALKNRGKFGAEGYDLRASVADQAYGGVAAETDLGRAAVQATAGEVLTYRGEPITTFFHSTCGGSTASPEEAFRTVSGTPYLRPVSDRRSGGSYCEISPRFRWAVEWDGEMLRRIFRRTIPAVLGIDASTVDVISDVRVHRTGPSGRVTEARIRVGNGDIPVFAADVRSVFETPEGRLLGSTAVRFEATAAGGAVSRLTAHGSGWGHGVGMCQWGAVGRARAGQDAETIVTTYFPGTRLERWY